MLAPSKEHNTSIIMGALIPLTVSFWSNQCDANEVAFNDRPMDSAMLDLGLGTYHFPLLYDYGTPSKREPRGR